MEWHTIHKIMYINLKRGFTNITKMIFAFQGKEVKKVVY